MSRTQEKIDQPTETTFAGIDVSKDTLDVCVLPHGVLHSFKNDKRGIKQIIAQYQEYGVKLLVPRVR